MGKLRHFIQRRKKKQTETKAPRQRLRYIAILPSIITLLNGIAGFIAIVYISRAANYERPLTTRFGLTLFAMAGYMIFLAMLADMLDGRVARLSKSTTSFGGQLDSLADAISFGVAPAFLMLKVMELEVRTLSFPLIFLQSLILKTIGFCAVVYMCGAIIRLARFNVENEEDESAHMHFSGLPSPAAAGTIVSLVIFQQDVLPRLFGMYEDLYRLMQDAFYWILPLVTLGVSILMVSRIRYPHVLNVYFRGKKPFSNFIWASVAILFAIWNFQFAAVVGFVGYALWGAIRSVVVNIQQKRVKGKEDQPTISVKASSEP